jgi:hypothetical protein
VSTRCEPGHRAVHGLSNRPVPSFIDACGPIEVGHRLQIVVFDALFQANEMATAVITTEWFSNFSKINIDVTTSPGNADVAISGSFFRNIHYQIVVNQLAIARCLKGLYWIMPLRNKCLIHSESHLDPGFFSDKGFEGTRFGPSAALLFRFAEAWKPSWDNGTNRTQKEL